MHYGTENVEFVNLCEGFQALREKKKCDYIYVSVVMAFSWHFALFRGGSIISRDERLNLNPSFNFFFSCSLK